MKAEKIWNLAKKYAADNYSITSDESYSKVVSNFFISSLKDDKFAKQEIYKKTLAWVNDIRTNRMKDQAPLDSLMPGNEMESESCTIARSLDSRYETCVGGSLLADTVGYDWPESNFPVSENLTWYAEWISFTDKDDYGYAELPWFAFMLAKAFDYGVYPELLSDFDLDD